MDSRYGYVSNNYHAHAMSGQARAISGSGGCQCAPYQARPHKQIHMPASQPMHMNKPVVMQQPMPMMMNDGRDARKMLFSQEGRDWTTGICGCFEHCGSCK